MISLKKITSWKMVNYPIIWNLKLKKFIVDNEIMRKMLK
jgi:hypothetical protein